MKAYIDKAVAVAEIERKMNLCKQILLRSQTRQDDDYHQGNIEAYEVVISLLDTLEVKEVDLEKEIHNAADQYDINNNGNIYWEDIVGFAKHFFELGLKAKGE